MQFLQQLICVLQVYGGSISIVIGAQLWSLNSFRGYSKVDVKRTTVSRLFVIFENCSISDSAAATSTTGGETVTLPPLGNFHHSLIVCVVQKRTLQRPLQDPMYDCETFFYQVN